jgi:putative hydrolase of the HAD superfamily
MSEMAEFARTIHESSTKSAGRKLVPVEYPAETEKLRDIRAVIFDVYGTIIDYWCDEFRDQARKEAVLKKAFLTVAERFGFTETLLKVNRADPPEKTLYDFYHGLITLKHDQAHKKGVEYPEIVIEEIWEVILTILKRNGYEPPLQGGENLRIYARKIAWYYNFHTLGRQLYPGVVDALEGLKQGNIVTGIVSNAQFYTPIDITLLIRDQSNGKYDDIFELFDVDLTFFSYEYKVAKPNKLLFRKLYDALYEYQILPAQTVFVGNDLLIDVQPAREAGMKTALFTGDNRSMFSHGLDGNIVPDITFSHWTKLVAKLSFHTEEN